MRRIFFLRFNARPPERLSTPVAASLCEARRLSCFSYRASAAHPPTPCFGAAGRVAATGLLLFASLCAAADWKIAEPGWQYEFPRDHYAHRDFKTEWWYFTGNIFDADGHRFGYELTFFRQGITPLVERDPKSSRFIVDDLKFAHFALTDVSKQTFRFQQKTSRGAFGEAGFDDGKRLAWIEDWTLATNGDDAFDLVASSEVGTIRFLLRATKPPVVHGENGVSVKAAADGHASHYYSIPRLQTTGEFFADGKSHPFQGESWFDHEWASGQLAKNQVGWDWICLQWENGTELMLYQMRLENGEPDASSSGTWIAQNGETTHLRSSDFRMTPIAFWESKVSGTKYPISWRVTLPGEQTEFVIRAAVENQELALGPITYWEGAIDASGTRQGQAIKGRGYLELTGYAGPLRELSR
jgi:predicted secreted hydrolase